MAKRFTKSTINWTDFQKRVPPNQQSQFLNFKSKYDTFMRRMTDRPTDPPKINWEHYQKLIPTPGFVDKIKSAYEAFKVPYPEDTLSAKIDEQWKTIEPEIKKYCADVQKDIDAANVELERINSLPKFDEMTMEMYFEMFPEEALDLNKPKYWPHTPDEQEPPEGQIKAAAAKDH